MYRIKRFSEEKISEKISKGASKAADWTKRKAKSIYESGKYAYEHPKETAVKVGNYVKKNPDEALMLIGSNVVPGVMAARYKMKGNKKAAALAVSATALPIGEAYVAGKVALRELMKKNKGKKKDE